MDVRHVRSKKPETFLETPGVSRMPSLEDMVIEEPPLPTHTDGIQTAQPNEEKIIKDLTVHITPWRKTLITIGLAVAGFMVGLDQAILQPAIPTITAQFNSINDIGAYQSAYLLPQCVLLPFCNKIFSMSSFSHVYLGHLLLFAGGSIISATCSTSPILIAGRAVSGLGAVGMSIGGFRLLALLPESKGQTLAAGIFSLVLGSSVVAGPILGGVLTTSLSWHWIFWVNLPVMAIVFICVSVGTLVGAGLDLRGENYSKPWLEKLKILDWLGTGLLAIAVVTLSIALELSQRYGWGDPRISIPLTLAPCALIALVVQQWKSPKYRIFDADIMRYRNVWAACGLGFSSTSAVGVLVIFLPFQFQLLKGLSAQDSGLRSFPLVLSITFGSFAASVLSTLVRYWNPFAIAGTMMLATSSCLFLSAGLHFNIGALMGYQILAGFGAGMSWICELIFPRAVLDKHQLAKSLSYTRQLQQLGSAFSVQIASLIFNNRLKYEVEHRKIQITPDGLSSLIKGDSGESAKIPGALDAVSGAINSGIILAVVWAALTMTFAFVLPWPRLKKGVTDREHRSEKTISDSSGESGFPSHLQGDKM